MKIIVELLPWVRDEDFGLLDQPEIVVLGNIPEVALRPSCAQSSAYSKDSRWHEVYGALLIGVGIGEFGCGVVRVGWAR
ncbi:hypothetical protein BH23ACT4_BH23ACT4_16560 [soil metagenome]